MPWNSQIKLRLFFSTNDKPIPALEFIEFWTSLSLGQQLYYRSVNLG